MGQYRLAVGNLRARKRRPRADRSTADTFTGFEPPQHTMWTFEGQIEQMGRFARMLNRSTGWRRWAGKAMFTLPLWVMVGGGVVIAVAALLNLVF